MPTTYKNMAQKKFTFLHTPHSDFSQLDIEDSINQDKSINCPSPKLIEVAFSSNSNWGVVYLLSLELFKILIL